MGGANPSLSRAWGLKRIVWRLALTHLCLYITVQFSLLFHTSTTYPLYPPHSSLLLPSLQSSKPCTHCLCRKPQPCLQSYTRSSSSWERPRQSPASSSSSSSSSLLPFSRYFLPLEVSHGPSHGLPANAYLAHPVSRLSVSSMPSSAPWGIESSLALQQSPTQRSWCPSQSGSPASSCPAILRRPRKS